MPSNPALDTVTFQPSLHKELRDATSLHHRRIESNPLLMQLMSEHVSWSTYALVLRRLWGFYQPLEERLYTTRLWAQEEWQGFSTPKTSLLAADLAGLAGPPLLALAKCRELPVLRNRCSALGVLYVLEGSALGGRIIRRHLLTQLGPDIANVSSFYDCYGDQLGRHWRNTIAAIDHLGGATSASRRTTVEAARATFEALDLWLRKAL